MNITKGMGDLVPSPNPSWLANLNPVMDFYNTQDAQAQAAAAKAAKGANVFGLGCTNQNVCWDYACQPDAPNNQQGRDVLWMDTGLNGLGDRYPAHFAVPQNPIVPGLAGYKGAGYLSGNALARSLAGLNGIDVSSLQAFEQSAVGGTSFGLPNLLVIGGAIAALLMLNKGRR